MNKYYTYAFLRADKTPYYVGKGCGRRRYMDAKKRRVKPPADHELIIILKDNLTEAEAYKHEIYMIAVLGLKVDGGLLRNFTAGGEGCRATPKVRAKISKSLTGRSLSLEHKASLSVAMRGPHSRERIQKRAASRCRPLTLRNSEGELETFPSRKECARQLGVNTSVVSALICGRQKSCRGYTNV